MHGDRHDGVAGEPHHHHADGLHPANVSRQPARNAFAPGFGGHADHDSAGFISQRMLASIVNLASDIAQQRIASPAISTVRSGLAWGIPRPLAFGAPRCRAPDTQAKPDRTVDIGGTGDALLRDVTS